MMRKATLAVVFLTLAALAGFARAQQYPTHLIKMMHGFPPGGNVDVIARIMAQEMSNGLGQPIVVESKAGAVGSVAAEAVAHAAPDGYTLLLVPSAHAVTGAIYQTLKYRPVDDFAWVSTVSFYPFVICVRRDSKFHTLAELLAAAARQRRGGVVRLVRDRHDPAHDGRIARQCISREISAHPLPRRSAGLDRAFDRRHRFPDFHADRRGLSRSESGEFRALAVTSRARWAKLPDVPTVDEAGVPGFEMTSWSGLAAPAGTPADIVAQLNAEVRRSIEVPQVKSRLESFGGDVRAMAPDEMRTLVADQLALWSRVARENNIRAE